VLPVSDMSEPVHKLRVEAGGLLPRAERLTDFVPPQRFIVPEHLKGVMLEAQAHNASDVYIQPGLPICARINGDLMALTPSTLDESEVMYMIKWTSNRDTAETDILSGVPVNARYELFSPTERDARGAKLRYGYRVNISPILNPGGTSGQIVLRSIPNEPIPFYKIGLPETLVRDCIPESGLVYIAGATGSGKTTTFAAIIRYILENDTPIKGNLLTHEEPIEFTYDQINSQHSIIVQSEVPQHFKDFYAANREAMRRKPGLVLVGEMRDEETIRAGVELSLTGHPVFATVHATDVPSVMRRLISRFPSNERATAIYDIVDTARMIMAQRLVKGIDGKLIAVREYLKFTDEIRDELAELDQMGKITSVIARIVEEKGHSFRKEASTLLAEGRITKAVAESIFPPQKEQQLKAILASQES
jgi:defect in organelle trafficking protein DotB